MKSAVPVTIFWLVLPGICFGLECRDQNLWPFNSTSVWNTPIGSAAQFKPAYLFSETSNATGLPDNFFTDTDYFVSTSFTDPVVEWLNYGNWDWSKNHCIVQGPLYTRLNFPVSWSAAMTSNNAAAILRPDNVTMINTQPLVRCETGDGPIMSLVPEFPDVNIRNDSGNHGAHGGSGLSSIGGTVRLGELLPNSGPMRHSLKLQLWAHNYYYDQRPGYVWPATQCDGYAFTPGPDGYGGTLPYLSPGSLFAIPSSVNLTLQTLPARKLAWTLTNYGGYLCDDTYANRGTFNVEVGVQEEFAAAYGFEINAWSGPFYDDLLAIFQALQVVVNNGPTSIGGGGIPLQPPPPPFCDY